MRDVRIDPTFESWQSAARGLLREGIPPGEVQWNDGTIVQSSLLSLTAPRVAEPVTEYRVPARFMELAQRAAAHRDPQRWDLLYRILWRIVRENRDLLTSERDPDIAQLMKLSEPTARPFVPQASSVDALREAVKNCRGCELYKYATQAVFSRGPQNAQIALVGEVPGDQEDLRGAPFVGPAGEVLDRALAEARLERAELYVTNAVKHFKFERVGKRRIHKTPTPVEVSACRPWLEAELDLVRPQIVVCLGATAARSMIGDQFRLMKQHGQWMKTRWSAQTIATIHPSAVLRGDDPPAQERNYAILVEDLGKVASARDSSR
ncbi:MAG TPA: UdgX family uracil-DNA binding protein [Thermoanaerobaculia bacterium]|nr:UdgX family uracil-DNA binding protein [Thermoanaerobaculia bacterium]